ncbi:MAG TPA: transcriptional regulator [Planctomycetaceae bacterium]|nr:transcriptional regulator [Planctomycetaceae bacterium]
MSARSEKHDKIWKALADRSRRDILDMLAERPLSTGEIVARFDNSLSRTMVMKHLDVLVAAQLVIVRREGRSRWNYLNPAPIQDVCNRWISKHVRHVSSAMSRLKELVEEREESKTAARESIRRKKQTGPKVNLKSEKR